jgi:hypothetical protein
MPNLTVLIQQGEVCRCLRSKNIFYEDPRSDAAADASGPFWCAHTQSLLGPDGKVAEPETCRPGRGCCETA